MMRELLFFATFIVLTAIIFAVLTSCGTVHDEPDWQKITHVMKERRV